MANLSNAEIVPKMASPSTLPPSVELADTPRTAPIAPTFDTFTLFPNLPLELRLLIFATAVAGIDPRNIEILGNATRSVNGACGPVHLAASVTAPCLLHCCHDSREIAKKTYKVCFGDKFTQGPIYFHWAKDALVLRNYEVSKKFFEPNFGCLWSLPALLLGNEEVFAKLQNLIVDTDPYQMINTFRHFKMLRRLWFGPASRQYFQHLGGSDSENDFISYYDEFISNSDFATHTAGMSTKPILFYPTADEVEKQKLLD